MIKYGKIGVAGVLALTLTWAAAPAFAQKSVKEFYQGKQITIAIGYGFGGTYGKYSRTFSEFLRKYIPGNPNIIVQSMPGAGGIKMTNYAGQVMPRQGYHLLVPPDTTVVSQLLRPKKVKYDAKKFTWLGSSNQTNTILVVRNDTGVKNVADLKRIRVIVGHTGPGSTAYLIPKTAQALLGLNLKIIGGYKGSRNTVLAMEQNEIQSASFNWLAWNSIVPHWFVKGREFATPILQLGHFRDPALPNVPMMNDLVKPADRPITEFLATLGVIGRGLAFPPNTPKWLAEPMRTAYAKMNADPAFAATLKKRRLRLMPSTGAEIQKVVNNAFASADPKVIARARKILFGK
jgi:tripartite-type tricarboxylate transporter receptor subunit TctC